MRLTGLGDINAVALAIQAQEGYAPGTLAYTNSNPGNLVPAGQPGCVPGAGGFCAFPDYATGLSALQNQINLDASRGYTLLQFATKYLGGDPSNPGVAPGGDPVAYANALAAASGVGINDSLSLAINGGGIYDVPVDSGTSDASAIDPTTLAMLALAGVLVFVWSMK